MTAREKVRQCKTCPWRVGAKPKTEIPGYDRDLHKNLTCTIQSGTQCLTGPLHLMVCHNTEETPCAGWLENQIGVGNNLAVRLGVMCGRLPVPEVIGPQHETLEATIPKRGSRGSL